MLPLEQRQIPFPKRYITPMFRKVLNFVKNLCYRDIVDISNIAISLRYIVDLKYNLPTHQILG